MGLSKSTRLKVLFFIYLSMALTTLISCSGSISKSKPGPGRAGDSIAVFEYIHEGNKVYAEKKNIKSFIQSLKYYDSAEVIADHSGDTLLLAEVTFAKGRIYDAWNREPQKTIACFSKAALYFRKVPGQYSRSLYVQHLVAHAYDKIKDSTNATAILRQMYRELATKDTGLLHSLPFTAEMALIATEVNAYELADSILSHLTTRAWISNDSTTYDYLNHYYLTQSRLDAYWRKPAHSFYLDSLAAVYERSNFFDKIYYNKELSKLCKTMGRYELSSEYYEKGILLGDSLNAMARTSDMQTALLQSELTAEKRKIEYEETIRSTRILTIWMLAGLVVIITMLSVYLYRRNKMYQAQSERLSVLNEALDDKVAQVELLNKEIQHRVKNNLHMIYSLLQMQERKTDNEEVLCNLRAARLRVESVAALHNQLVTSESSPDFTVFLKTLISSAVNCLSDEKNVLTHISAQDIKVPVNSYFALSLILNEWVTNSVKYGAGQDELLTINVSIKNETNQVCIEYSDSGTPMPFPQGKPGLGTQIIDLLSRQMSGTLTTLHGNPYHYQLCIPNGT